MSTPDSYASQVEFDMDAIAAADLPQVIPPFIEYVVPLKALGRIAVRDSSDGVSRVLAAAVAMGETEVTISRQERSGWQVGPRYVVRFRFDQPGLVAACGERAVHDFSVQENSEKLCVIIDGTPEDAGVQLPWREPADKPWWKFW